MFVKQTLHALQKQLASETITRHFCRKVQFSHSYIYYVVLNSINKNKETTQKISNDSFS